MTDSEVTKGTEGEPTPKGSDNGTGQRSSEEVTITKKDFDALMSEVQLLKRQTQGDKDRAVKRTNQRLDTLEQDIKGILKGALQSGQSVSQLLEQIESGEREETDSLLREMAMEFSRNRKSPGGTEQSGVDVTKLLQELELPESDLRVQQFKAQKWVSEAEAAKEAAKLVKTIVTKQLGDADTSSKVAGGKEVASKQEALMQEYQEGSKNLRGQALMNYKMEMRKKGLHIS